MSDSYSFSDPMNGIYGSGPGTRDITGTEYMPQNLDQAAWNVNDNTLGQPGYDFSYLTFPSNISNDDIGHYVVININVPVSLFSENTPRTAFRGNLPGIAGQTLVGSEASKVDALRFGGADPVINNNRGARPLQPGTEAFAVPRFTRRIRESIAIHMPTPVVFNSQNDYQEISLSAMATGLLSQVGGFAGGFLGARYGGIEGGQAGASTGASIGQGVNNALRNTSMLGRYPINPRVEVLFSRTTLRQFVFEFLFAPRNQQESDNMEKIIRTLRFHSAPEIDPTFGGITFIPPAEFDITFYHQGIENRKIPRINTCVMDRIEVDYAPQGEYSTFSNGHPVAARLSLGMREVEVLHKNRVLQGF
jgi:hypothetical protein